MLRHLVRCGLIALIASTAALIHAQTNAQGARPSVLPAIQAKDAPPQSDYAPGVPRAGTPGTIAPDPIKRVDPKYTSDAMKAGVQGIIVLDAVIAADGSVEQSRVRCSLHPSLDAAAQKAFNAWTFKPALLNGVPTRFVVQVEMEFRQFVNGAPPQPASAGSPRGAGGCKPPG